MRKWETRWLNIVKLFAWLLRKKYNRANPCQPLPKKFYVFFFSENEEEENNIPEQEEEEQPLVIAEPEQDQTKKNHIKENHVADGDTENHSLYNAVNSRQRSIHNSKKDSLIWSHNTRLKHAVYRELKKPGRSKCS